MISSPEIKQVSAALLAAQKSFPAIIKDKTNPFFNSLYADLAACLTATQPVLQAAGLIVMQFPTSDANGVGVLTLITHPASGEYIGHEYTLPLAKHDAQTGVAAVTYARRAAYLGALGIAAQDDDGNEASGHPVEGTSPYVPPPSNLVQIAPATSGSGSAPFQPPLANVAPGLPNDQEALDYNARLKKLLADLQTYGNFTPTGKGCEIKLKNFVLHHEHANNLNELTVEQWEDFFARVDINTSSVEFGGWPGLARKIDEVNGVTAETAPQNSTPRKARRVSPKEVS